jgi:hypothetical protein
VRTLGRIAFCFVVLPLVPFAAVALFALEGPAWQDIGSQNGVLVGAIIGVALAAGVIGYRPRQNPLAGVGYAVTTGALSVGAFYLLLVLWLIAACDGSSDCL